VGGFLIVNPRSGDESGTGDLREAAEEHGVRVHVLAEGDDLAEVARSAPDGPVGMAGGDGSLAPVAEACLERGVPFVTVPFGTRNHFARDLGLDREDPVAAMEAFSGDAERSIDVGRANGRLFLNNVSLGVYARLVYRRERHRRRRNALARLRALAAVVQHPHRAGFMIDGMPVSARILLVANNSYNLELLSLGGRDRLDEGCLHLYAPTGIFRSRWEERRGESFVVGARSPRLRAAVDGEPDALETPIDFRLEASVLRVLLPPAVAQAYAQAATEEEGEVENPEPTEREQELAQTDRQEDEEAMRGPDTPQRREQEPQPEEDITES
jgi:diacylglycerol kinase family enzyme